MEKLLTIEEVAEVFRCSVDTIKRSSLPFTRMGKARLYHPKIVAKYQLAHSSRPALWKDMVEAA